MRETVAENLKAKKVTSGTSMIRWDVDWVMVKADYIGNNNGQSLADVAEKYGLPMNIVTGRASKEGWTRERDARIIADTHRAANSFTARRNQIIDKWNEDTVKEAEMIRMAARTLYMAKGEDGKLRIKADITPAELGAVAAANATADRIVRLAIGVATDNVATAVKSLPASVDDFV